MIPVPNESVALSCRGRMRADTGVCPYATNGTFLLGNGMSSHERSDATWDENRPASGDGGKTATSRLPPSFYPRLSAFIRVPFLKGRCPV